MVKIAQSVECGPVTNQLNAPRHQRARMRSLRGAAFPAMTLDHQVSGLMPNKSPPSFDVDSFLATAGPGHTVIVYKNGEVIFSQGDRADDVFYVREGKIKITVVSQRGKEAVIAIVPAGQFFGELALNG